MFASKQTQSHCLPPCQDALRQHTKRANYQAAIWRRALFANHDVPSPENHGWIIQEEKLSLNWMLLPPAPAALLDLIMCGCTGNCSTGHCIVNGMAYRAQMLVCVLIDARIPTMPGKMLKRIVTVIEDSSDQDDDNNDED